MKSKVTIKNPWTCILTVCLVITALGYLFYTTSGKKLFNNVEWIVRSQDDSLAVFSNGIHRGYLNLNTGNTIIPPRYNHAWLFSEGLAAVDSAGAIGFIKRNGQRAFQATFPNSKLVADHLFHAGHCTMAKDDRHIGLIDHEGRWALSPNWQAINHDNGYWTVYRNGRWGLLDSLLHEVLPPEYLYISIAPGDGILATDGTHICRLLDFDGLTTLHPMVISNAKNLFYYIEDENMQYQATCMQYSSSPIGGRYGLLAPNGKIVTPPVYSSIEALSDSLYICMPQGEIICYSQESFQK